MLELRTELDKYPNLINFDDNRVGKIRNYEYHLKVKPNVNPVRHSPSKTSFENMRIVDQEVEKLLAKGIIRPSISDYSSRTVIVRRKDGRPRLCIDYRDVNTMLESDSYPVPNIDMCLRLVKDAIYITKLDMNDSFHQIKLADSSTKYTGFVTPSGRFYEYMYVPYGTKVSTAAFQRALDLATMGMKYIDLASFVDDLLIPANTWSLHMSRLSKILAKLDEFGFTLKTQKCAFAMDKVVFLGFLVSADRIEPCPSLLEAIDSLREPTTVTEVRSVLGLLNYPRKCVQKFSINVEPIVRLTRKDQPFIWGAEQQKSFDQIKQIYRNIPFVVYFNPSLETELSVDASSIGIGGALMQKHSNAWQPVGYFSRLLTDNERKWSIYGPRNLSRS